MKNNFERLQKPDKQKKRKEIKIIKIPRKDKNLSDKKLEKSLDKISSKLEEYLDEILSELKVKLDNEHKKICLDILKKINEGRMYIAEPKNLVACVLYYAIFDKHKKYNISIDNMVDILKIGRNTLRNRKNRLINEFLDIEKYFTKNPG